MIFYFSATGNTRWAANKLSQLLHDKLIYIPSALQGDCIFDLAPDEPVGFVFPIHGWRPPKIVREFINRLQLRSEGSEQRFIYSIVTAGDDIGMTMNILAKDLSRKGLTLRSGYSIIMPNTYVGLPMMDVDTPDHTKSKKKKAADRLMEVAEQIMKRKPIYKIKEGSFPRTKSYIIGEYFVKRLINDQKFWVDDERCIKCGICANVCPVNDIAGGHGQKPTWLHNDSCLTCFNCYHHCPRHAIEFGRFTKKKGQYFYT
ncbi:EFR1 family ferrodoxin [Prevotella sp.]|uniref:EFR1 family ferrodoxin n=1 Tax=Prevotella sp. TaxID=59823 RepID=UPI002F92B439